MPTRLMYLLDTCALVNIRDLHDDSEEIWAGYVNVLKTAQSGLSGRLWTSLS